MMSDRGMIGSMRALGVDCARMSANHAASTLAV
jgi:hypothetical protein